MERHAKTSDHFFSLISKDLTSASVDVEDSSVEMFELKFEANQRVNKRNTFFHEEISSFSSKNFMRFFLNNKNNISRKRVRKFIALSMKINSMTMESSLIQRNLKNLLFS